MKSLFEWNVIQFFLFFLWFDRYFAIVYPFERLIYFERHTKTVIAIIWTFGKTLIEHQMCVQCLAHRIEYSIDYGIEWTNALFNEFNVHDWHHWYRETHTNREFNSIQHHHFRRCSNSIASFSILYKFLFVFRKYK